MANREHPLKGEQPWHRWARADGRQLTLTDRGRLRERLTPRLPWVQVRCPCAYEEAIVYALCNGFRWVAEFPADEPEPRPRLVRTPLVGSREAAAVADDLEAGDIDPRCKVEVVRVLREQKLTVAEVREKALARFRERSLTPLPGDLEKAPLAYRAQREFRIRMHALRVALPGRVGMAARGGWSGVALCRHCRKGVGNRRGRLCRACEAAGVSPLRPRQPCRHCGLRLGNRRRGLCWHCYDRPGVREQYPCGSVA